ncbi:CBS domain-containing protein [Clostridium akagii]|uniref:CBS domain-containing protein n=1 Tax=Clostridium akagii TaxID=91623 RepID=UPI0004792C9B|nr:CBS domain-containing protein [Clostridium akagii]
MTIVFFLTPKKEVIYGKLTSTVRQILEKMKYHNCIQIPILDNHGIYVGTVTKDDLVRKIKNSPEVEFKDFNKVGILDIVRQMVIRPVHIDCKVEDLPNDMINQGFTPVVDDNNIFIGIIKKSDLINSDKYASMNNMRVRCM